MVSDFFEGQWIEVFKAGQQTDSAGNTRIWTEADLNKIVKLYKEQEDHEAPLVIGHPKDNDPAYGWVEDLKTDGKLLYAQFKQVAEGMGEAVKSGLLKKRSISLYPNLLLRHIGFLGAVPPAVKGLADIQYKEDNDSINIEFSDDFKWDVVARLLQRVRDSLIEKYGVESADNLIRIWDINDLQIKETEDTEQVYSELIKQGEERMSKELLDKITALEASKVQAEKDFNEKLRLAEEAATTATAQFEEIKTKKEELELQVSKFQEELNKNQPPVKTAFEEAAEKRIMEIETQLKAAEQKSRLLEYKEFVKGLHDEGKVVTEQQGLLIDLMESVQGVEEFNFSDGKASVQDKLKAYLSAQPVLVSFGETKDKHSKRDSSSSAGEELDKLALGFCEADKSLSYSEAIAKAQELNPELANKASLEL